MSLIKSEKPSDNDPLCNCYFYSSIYIFDNSTLINNENKESFLIDQKNMYNIISEFIKPNYIENRKKSNDRKNKDKIISKTAVGLKEKQDIKKLEIMKKIIVIKIRVIIILLVIKIIKQKMIIII